MSSEHAELVRRAVAAAYRRPKPDYAVLSALYHPDHEQIPLASRVEGRPGSRGARGFREFLDSMRDAFASWEVRIDDVRSIDDDRVLVEGLFVALGKRGGVPVEQHFAELITVRDGKIARTEVFSSAEDALETVEQQGRS